MSIFLSLNPCLYLDYCDNKVQSKECKEFVQEHFVSLKRWIVVFVIVGMFDFLGLPLYMMSLLSFMF